MCGIAGLLASDLRDDEWRDRLNAMTQTLAHRGPDDFGTWFDGAMGIGLGNRRLAILDRSAHGHQPMSFGHGRYWITYNGEVYNYRDLQSELRSNGHHFQGNSDTEVVLAAIAQWGLADAVRRFNGMFAFALWDREAGTLHLVRDRLGIKPLYYGWLDNQLAFASELKALRVHPNFPREIDRDALTLLLRHGCIPAPYSVFKGIRKQRQGTILTFPVDRPRMPPHETTYWSLKEVVEASRSRVFRGTEEDAAVQLHSLLKEAVGLRLLADVPVGAFLSGGIDSSTIVALMQEQSRQPTKTFSVGFEEKAFDESVFAREVAARLGTDHTELQVRPEDALSILPRLPEIYDEPFADYSQIPTFLISQLARQSVTVALVGDGGDELFGGYPRHMKLLRASQKYRLPLAFGRIVGRWMGPRPENGRATRGNRGASWNLMLRGHVPAELFIRPISRWKVPLEVVKSASEPMTTLTNSANWPRVDNFALQMMYIDTSMYLHDQLLVKLDRASMAVGLEARVPFLDHRVVEFSWSLPIGFKLTRRQNKRVLRHLLRRYLPPRLIDRPKHGFSIPLSRWLRGPLRGWAESLLAERRLEEDGFFHPEQIRNQWKSHLEGSHGRHHNSLWSVLMFQAWLDHERGSPPRRRDGAHEGQVQ